MDFERARFNESDSNFNLDGVRASFLYRFPFNKIYNYFQFRVGSAHNVGWNEERGDNQRWLFRSGNILLFLFLINRKYI